MASFGPTYRIGRLSHLKNVFKSKNSRLSWTVGCLIQADGARLWAAFAENDKIASELFVIIISLLKVIKERKQILLTDFLVKTNIAFKSYFDL